MKERHFIKIVKAVDHRQVNLHQEMSKPDSHGARGATMIEYVALATLVCIVVLAAVAALGSRTQAVFSGAASAMES